MLAHVFDTVSEAINTLTKEGFKEDFKTQNKSIVGSYSGNQYAPYQLKIVEIYRFDGYTDPEDEATVFAIIAVDGTKGTMVMSNSANHNYDTELIKGMRTK